MRLLWLPDLLRQWGLTVVTQPGWTTRGESFPALPEVVIGHHTGTRATAPGELPTLRVLVEGRSDLPGPLCQVALSRTGVAHVIASGKANHAGRGAWEGVTSSNLTVGIEVEHPGSGPWLPAQLGAFDRVAAALLSGLGQRASNYCGHREWALPEGRKVDPAGVDLDAQRARIAHLLAPRPIVTEDPEMFLFRDPRSGRQYLREGGVSVWLNDGTDVSRFVKAGVCNVGDLTAALCDRLTKEAVR